MPRALLAVAALVAVLAGALWARQRMAGPDLGAADAPEDPTATDAGGALDGLDALNPFAQLAQSDMTQSAIDPNAAAFLAVLRRAEGTDQRSDPYRVCYAFRHTVQDARWHPAETHAGTREWTGEPLDALGPTYRGLVSTAAGAYQIKLATWLGCKRALGLADFTSASQDAAALYLIKGRGALADVLAGRFDDAIAKCAPEWASLPGANYAGQPMRQVAALRETYLDAGGALA